MQKIGYAIFLFGTIFIGTWSIALPAHADTPDAKQKLPPDSTASFMLIASRDLKDQRFSETVILVTRLRHNMPIGVIINLPQEMTLDKLHPELPEAENIKLFAGGPVNPKQISYLFKSDQDIKGSLEISDQLYFSNDIPMLGKLLSGEISHQGLKVVYGFSAWAPKQLVNEVDRGDWLIQPVDEEAIFNLQPEKIWPELHHRANIQYTAVEPPLLARHITRADSGRLF
ncbi:MAG: YqgE/AlgH family protein [Gallionella sp.]